MSYIRLKDIAEIVGVKVPTVSVVLRNKQTTIRVSDETREKILKAARDLSYNPNATALALITGKTARLGAILSDSVTDGWGNPYFSRLLDGAQQRCQEINLGLQISKYNISNLENFKTPHKISSRSVDGYMLMGSTDASVLGELLKVGVPFVCIKESVENRTKVDSVVSDLKAGIVQMVRHSLVQGHKKFAIFDSAKPWRRQMLATVNHMLKEAGMDASIEFLIPEEISTDRTSAADLFRRWQSLTESQRPSVLLGSMDIMLSLHAEFMRHGIKCPDDIKFCSTYDDDMLGCTFPRFSAINRNLSKHGAAAVDMLARRLSSAKKTSGKSELIEIPTEFIPRESL